MEKLNKNLLDILKNSDDKLNYLDLSEKEINDKFKNYLENKETKKIVGEYLSNIYENKKDDAIKIMNDIKSDLRLAKLKALVFLSLKTKGRSKNRKRNNKKTKRKEMNAVSLDTT